MGLGLVHHGAENVVLGLLTVCSGACEAYLKGIGRGASQCCLMDESESVTSQTRGSDWW